MKLETILDEWDKDSDWDKTDLGGESMRNAKLHAKYLRYFTEERLRAAQLKGEKDQLFRAKHDYYAGKMSDEERESYNWEPFQLTLAKTEIEYYMRADQDVIDMNLKVALQEERVQALDMILKHIGNRGFSVKAAIDWARLMNGA